MCRERALPTISQADRYPKKRSPSWGAQVAEGLEAAHEKGIIHRDLKPGNVMVTPKGQAKVLDFGIAKLMRAGGETTVDGTATETHGAPGTLPYMAPEQLLGEAVDARTDVYALGALLYQTATGERPFQGDLAARLMNAILHETPQTPRARNARVSPELERIILKCLEKEPENRYQSAREVEVDLRRLGTTGSVSAFQARRSVLTRRQAATAVGVALAALLAVLAGLNVEKIRERLGAGPSRIQSIAVLPLENLSGDPEQDYFAAGMHDALITDLAKLGGFERVIARSSVMRYQETEKPLSEIARELNVDAVITGSVLRAFGRPGAHHGPTHQCGDRGAPVGRPLRAGAARRAVVTKRDRGGHCA